MRSRPSVFSSVRRTFTVANLRSSSLLRSCHKRPKLSLGTFRVSVEKVAYIRDALVTRVRSACVAIGPQFKNFVMVGGDWRWGCRTIN